MTTPKQLTALQLAEILGLNPRVVARHTRQGRYPFARNIAGPGMKPIWRYDPRGLERWLDSRPSRAL